MDALIEELATAVMVITIILTMFLIGGDLMI